MALSPILWPSEIEKFLTSDLNFVTNDIVNDISQILSNDIILLLKFINYVKSDYLIHLLMASTNESFSECMYKIIHSPNYYIRKNVLKAISHSFDTPYDTNYAIALINRKKCYLLDVMRDEYVDIETIYEKYTNHKIINQCVPLHVEKFYEPELNHRKYFGCVKYIKMFKLIIRFLDFDDIANWMLLDNKFNIYNCKQLIIIARETRCNFYVGIGNRDDDHISAIYTWPEKYHLAVNLIFYLQLLIRKRKSENIIMFSGNSIEKLIKKILSGFTNCNMQKLILYYV